MKKTTGLLIFVSSLLFGCSGDPTPTVGDAPGAQGGILAADAPPEILKAREEAMQRRGNVPVGGKPGGRAVGQ